MNDITRADYNKVVRALAKLYPSFGESNVTNLTQMALAHCVFAMLFGVTYCGFLPLVGFLWKSIWLLAFQLVFSNLQSKEGFEGVKVPAVILAALLIAEYVSTL